MNTEQIEKIANISADNLRSLFGEMSDDIAAAAVAAAQQAQDDGKEKLKLSLSHTITIDLGSMKQTDKLSVAVKRHAQFETTFADAE